MRYRGKVQWIIKGDTAPKQESIQLISLVQSNDSVDILETKKKKRREKLKADFLLSPGNASSLHRMSNIVL